MDWPTASIGIGITVAITGLAGTLIKNLKSNKKSDCSEITTVIKKHQEELTSIKSDVELLKKSVENTDKTVHHYNEERKEAFLKLEQRLEKVYEKLLDWITK